MKNGHMHQIKIHFEGLASKKEMAEKKAHWCI